VTKDRLNSKPAVLDLLFAGKSVVVHGDRHAGVVAFGLWVADELNSIEQIVLRYDFVEGTAHEPEAVLDSLVAQLEAAGVACERYRCVPRSQNTTYSIANNSVVLGSVNPVIEHEHQTACRSLVGALLEDVKGARHGIHVVIIGVKLQEGTFMLPAPRVWDILKVLLYGLSAMSEGGHTVLVAAEGASVEDFPRYFHLHELGLVNACDCDELSLGELSALFVRGQLPYDEYVSLLARLEVGQG